MNNNSIENTQKCYNKDYNQWARLIDKSLKECVGKTSTSVISQLIQFNKNNIIVAYEPIWSIGTGKIPTANDLRKTAIYIKKILKGIFKKTAPAVLYGGSVDRSNVEMFKEIREIDGFLIGGASKTSKKFIDIIKNYYR